MISSSETLLVLQRNQALGGLAEGDMLALASLCANVHFDKGITLYTKGQDAKDVLIVRAGRVALSVISEDGRTALLDIIGAGSILGGVGIFHAGRQTRPFHTMALTSVDVLRIERDALMQLMMDRPAVAIGFLSHMADVIHKMSEVIEETIFLDTGTRLARYLVKMADTMGRPTPNGVLIEPLLSQEQIGQILGVSREIVNKALKNLRIRGYVTASRGKIIVLNPNGLRAITKV